MLHFTYGSENGNNRGKYSDNWWYRRSLRENSTSFQITIDWFNGYLKYTKKRADFLMDLIEIEKDQKTLEGVAVSWQIPVILVKYHYNIMNF